MIPGCDMVSPAMKVAAFFGTGLEVTNQAKDKWIAEDEMTKDLVASINSEIVNTLVINLQAACPTQNMTIFDYLPPNATSYLENKQHLKDIISATEANILKSANRGNITVLIAGAGACSVLSTLPGWIRLSDGASMGPHIFGTIDGTVVVRIPNPAVLASNLIMTLYKGPAPSCNDNSLMNVVAA